MRQLRVGQIVEAVLWIGFAIFLFVFTFEFDREIEIYRYGATAWPRVILWLVVIAALGQLLHQWLRGDQPTSEMVGESMVEGTQATENQNHLAWYVHTFAILAIPFVYILAPDWIATALGLEKSGLHITKLILAGLLLGLFVFAVQDHPLGGMLALPILFAAMLQDMGFYSLAPFFIMAVMFLMGERRIRFMLSITAGIYGILLFLFVSLLYVGLPTGNISPFYGFGTGLVNILQ